MSITLEDILNSICSEVTLSHTNDFQKVFSLSTPLEAKLAFEVLVVYGLDVKVYHAADKPSKLYITHPTQSQAQIDKIYAAALAYAKTLKQIKLSVESLCKDNEAALAAVDYNIAFLKGTGAAKQIVVQIVPSNDAQAMAQGTAVEAPAAASAPSPAASAAVASGQVKVVRKYGEKPKSHYEELSSGPAVGRGNYPGKLSADGEAQANSVRRRMGLVVFSNMTTSSFATFIIAIIVGIFLSVFVMMKGFICPDLAVANKNRAWYCGSYGEEPNAKPKQQGPVAPR